MSAKKQRGFAHLFKSSTNRFYFNLWMGLICLIWNFEFKFQVAELFHDLKERVRAFNMCVNDQPCALGQESVYKQRFILQVMLYWLFRGEPLFTKFMTGFLYSSIYELVSHLCFKILCKLRLQLKKNSSFWQLRRTTNVPFNGSEFTWSWSSGCPFTSDSSSK